jgi:predicted amidohydrolase
MTRYLNVAIGQLGPIQRADTRPKVVARLRALMRQAKAVGAQLIVFPELALTSFFPRWYIEDEAEINSFFERSMPSAATQPLFDLCRELDVGFYLGYAELAQEAGRGCALQHIHPGRRRRQHRRKIPQGAPARP